MRSNSRIKSVAIWGLFLLVTVCSLCVTFKNSKTLGGKKSVNPVVAQAHVQRVNALDSSHGINAEQGREHAAPGKRSSPKLNAKEEEFLSDVENLFGKVLIAGLDKEATREHLSRLNERGVAGAKLIALKLTQPPLEEVEIRARIAFADYLLYRARFDLESRQLALELSKSVPSESIPTKIRGAMFAERGELLGGLVAIDFEETKDVLANLKNPLLRRIAAAETVIRLTQEGMKLEDARSKVKAVIPEYKI